MDNEKIELINTDDLENLCHGNVVEIPEDAEGIKFTDAALIIIEATRAAREE